MLSLVIVKQSVFLHASCLVRANTLFAPRDRVSRLPIRVSHRGRLFLNAHRRAVLLAVQVRNSTKAEGELCLNHRRRQRPGVARAKMVGGLSAILLS